MRGSNPSITSKVGYVTSARIYEVRQSSLFNIVKCGQGGKPVSKYYCYFTIVIYFICEILSLFCVQVLLLLPAVLCQEDETTTSPVEQIFTPSVSATCRAGIMTIR